MEILKISASILVFSTFFSACSGKEKETPRVDESFCEPMCEKVVRCSKDIKTKSRKEKVFKNKQTCINICKKNLNSSADNKSQDNSVHSFYSFFLGLQKSCLDIKDCNAYMTCRNQKYHEAVNTFPMDDIAKSRCIKVCSKVSKCASLVVPRLMGKKFEELSEEKKAALIRKQSDTAKCINTCREFHVKKVIIDNTLNRDKSDNFFSQFNKAINCLGHNDCASFTKCTLLQSH
ncbi:MAG: hypothetical protein JXR95_09575 [Deltaproteobacteria bacterium]|nr:hypothetical protein [Deltaproteobacteria bacterium]